MSISQCDVQPNSELGARFRQLDRFFRARLIHH